MRRLLTPGWLACHVLAVGLVVGMLAMAGWQLSRATGGNLLSWGYTFQWPVFAGFVGFVWAREVRRVLQSGRAASPAAPRPPAHRPVITRRPAQVAAGPGGSDDQDDPALAAYNRYLAWLSANPGARPVDYPG
jgi:DNA-binding transcriptional regulator of glucitol operon